MEIETQGHVAVICTDQVLLKDGQSAMELLANVRHQTGCGAILLPKQAVSEDFFHLSTGLAGEILQKFVNYQMKLGIVGDFPGNLSENWKDFAFESNKGNTVCFCSTQEEALARL